MPASARTLRAYEDDLAYVHDEGFDWLARGAAPGILELLQGAGIREGLVVDLGCGTGLWARALVDAGFDVLGVDQSEAMLQLARQRVPEARFLRDSLMRLPIPPCVAVTSVGESGNYLFEGDDGAAALSRLFRRVHSSLKPDGLFVFDLAAPGRHSDRPQGVWRGEDWYLGMDTETDESGTRLRRRITTFRLHDGQWRRSDEVHDLRLHRPGDVLDMLRSCGFRARSRRSYGELELPEGLAAYVARRA